MATGDTPVPTGIIAQAVPSSATSPSRVPCPGRAIRPLGLLGPHRHRSLAALGAMGPMGAMGRMGTGELTADIGYPPHPPPPIFAGTKKPLSHPVAPGVKAVF